MYRFAALTVLFFVLFSVCQTSGLNAETVITPRIQSVALFKNGCTVVCQEADIPNAGVYQWNEVPAALHGTFFIESNFEVEVRTTEKTVKEPVDETHPVRSLNELDGTSVHVRFESEIPTTSSTYKLEDRCVLSGRLSVPAAAQNPNPLSLLYAAKTDGSAVYTARYAAIPTASSPTLSPAPLMLKTDDGKYKFLTGQKILFIETTVPVKELTVKKPVMLFTLKEPQGTVRQQTGGKLRLFYLTKGTTWMPSYRVNLLDGKKLTVEQTAQIRNESSPLNDTEMFLVSGFPQIQAEQVQSLLTPQQKLAQFFQQLTASQYQRSNRYANMISNSAMTQQAYHPSSVVAAGTGFDTTALAAGEGPDVYYNSIGKRTLDTGDTLSLTTGKGEAEYQRLLECDLAQRMTRWYNRNYNDNYGNTPSDQPAEIWDVLKFKNPLPFPMTTATAMTTEQNRFLGQSESKWTNPQQIASVKITKVMNVRADYEEEKSKSLLTTQNFTDFGTRYSYATKGTVSIVNQRNEEIVLKLEAAFLGSVDSVEPAPASQKVRAQPQDNYAPNSLTDLTWELKLKPGEEKVLTITGKRWYRN